MKWGTFSQWGQVGEWVSPTGAHQQPDCFAMSSSRRSRNQLAVFQSLAAQAPVHTWEDMKRTSVKNWSICVLNYHGRASHSPLQPRTVNGQWRPQVERKFSYQKKKKKKNHMRWQKFINSWFWTSLNMLKGLRFNSPLFPSDERIHEQWNDQEMVKRRREKPNTEVIYTSPPLSDNW